ncbi:MAG TPA: PHB depolymerase family esterase [Polyangiaceae bacterium]|nr:PHB depolymerase family esterase [Polyangiaceae bacterium]
MALWACTGCMPLDDWSSYRAANTQAADTAPSATDDGTLGADAGAPSGADDAVTGTVDEPAVSLDAGAPLDEASPESDPGEGSAPPTAGGSEPDAGTFAEQPPETLVGQSRQTLQVAGLQRSFIYYAPADLDPSVPVPVLIVAHGFEQTADDMVAITGYDTIADREGFVVLYPEGQGAEGQGAEGQGAAAWNIGSQVCESAEFEVASASGDDSALVDAMLAFVAAERRIDQEHVFMSGLGSGAYLAHELACRRSDIRAIAAHSGGSHSLQGCAAAPKPVLVLHGTEDSLVPPSCGVEAGERWVEHNGCTSEVETIEVQGGLCDVSRDCPVDGTVALCAFVGMGRGWAGGAAQAESYLDFASASELSWRFFELHAW